MDGVIVSEATNGNVKSRVSVETIITTFAKVYHSTNQIFFFYSV